MKYLNVFRIAMWLLAVTALTDPVCLRSADAPDLRSADTPEPKVEPDHKIQPTEILLVDVFLEKDLSKEYRVSGGGKITLFLLGEVDVQDKTTAEVETYLKEALGKDYLRNPQISVTVKEYRKRTVNVMGEVNKPGSIELPAEINWTIIDAISQAGGLTRMASKSKIEFTHKGKTRKFSLDELKKISDPAKIIYLAPGDIINVKESFL